MFRRKADCSLWCALCSGEKAGGGSDDDVDCGVLCVQDNGRLLTVVCFVFRGKAGGGSDEDADSGVLYLRGDHHPIGHTGLLQNTHTRLPPFRLAKRNNGAFIYSTQNV